MNLHYKYITITPTPKIDKKIFESFTTINEQQSNYDYESLSSGTLDEPDVCIG